MELASFSTRLLRTWNLVGAVGIWGFTVTMSTRRGGCSGWKSRSMQSFPVTMLVLCSSARSPLPMRKLAAPAGDLALSSRTVPAGSWMRSRFTW